MTIFFFVKIVPKGSTSCVIGQYIKRKKTVSDYRTCNEYLTQLTEFPTLQTQDWPLSISHSEHLVGNEFHK